MRVARGVGHERVAEVLERVVLDVPGQGGGDVLAGHPPELIARDHGGPALRALHAHVLAVIEGLVGEQGPLHEVDQVGADVVEPLALLVGVEEPGGADVGRPRHHLHQVVHALHVDAGIGLRAAHEGPERGRIVDELPLQLARDLVALGHDVERDQLARLRGVERALELGQVGRLQDPGLVHQRVEPGVQRGLDAVDLAAVAPGEDHRVARPVAQHLGQEVGRGVDLELPARRVVRALVEAGHAREMVDQVRTERRVDVDHLGDARIHLLLHQGGVEVAGIEGHETDVRHRRAPFRPQARTGGRGREESGEGEARQGDRASGHWT